MKAILSLFFATLLNGATIAQQPAAGPLAEPEFAGVVFRLAAGALIPLERQNTSIHTKASGFGVVHAKSVWEIAGAKSSIRFSSGSPLEFVVRTISAQVDPAQMYHIHKVDTKKKTREMLIATARATIFGSVSTNQIAEGEIPVAFTRYGEASVKITATGLAPGEYAIQAAPFQAIFCFGVD